MRLLDYLLLLTRKMKTHKAWKEWVPTLTDQKRRKELVLRLTKNAKID
jgi:hypothetical protein